MKTLSLAKPLVIAVIGLPGAGKSFFSRQFSETFSAPVVSNDKLRHEIYGDTPYAREQTSLISRVSMLQVEELLKTKKTFLVDGSGSTKIERAQLRKQAQAAGYDMLLVWVQTDEKTSKYRSVKRSSKRSDDMYNVSLTPIDYDRLAKRFSKPALNEEHTVISGKHTYATQARVVLKKLVAPREKEIDKLPIVNHHGRTPSNSADEASSARRNVLIR